MAPMLEEFVMQDPEPKLPPRNPDTEPLDPIAPEPHPDEPGPNIEPLVDPELPTSPE